VSGALVSPNAELPKLMTASKDERIRFLNKRGSLNVAN
jgi:hypothetical protein